MTIKNAREAKKLGLAWIELSIRMPDGSKHAMRGTGSPEYALRLWLHSHADKDAAVVVDRSLKCTHGLNVPGNYFVLRKDGDTSRGIGYVEEAFAEQLESALGQLTVSDATASELSS